MNSTSLGLQLHMVYLGFGYVRRLVGIQQRLKIWAPPYGSTLPNLDHNGKIALSTVQLGTCSENRLKGLEDEFTRRTMRPSVVHRVQQVTCHSGCIEDAVGASLLVSFRFSPSISAQ